MREAAAASGEPLGSFTSAAVGTFVARADDAAWLSLMAVTSKADDAGKACLRYILQTSSRRPRRPVPVSTGFTISERTQSMPTTAERVRAHNGLAILSYGFRPFFLFGALWAALVVAIWLPMLGGSLAVPTALSPLEWHAHELVYGYVPAIVAGFLLTAVPNWTGGLPVTGTPLLVLVSVSAGRLASCFLLGSVRQSGRIYSAVSRLPDRRHRARNHRRPQSW